MAVCNTHYSSETDHTTPHLVKRKTADETMAVKMGDRNHEMTTGVKPLRKGNCRQETTKVQSHQHFHLQQTHC